MPVIVTPPHVAERQEALDLPVAMAKLRKVTAVDTSPTLAQLLASQRYLEENSGGFDHIIVSGISMILLRFWLNAVSATLGIEMVSWPYGVSMGHTLYKGTLTTTATPPAEVANTDPVDQSADAATTWREVDTVSAATFNTTPTVSWRPNIGSGVAGYAQYALVDVGDARAFTVRIASITTATKAIVGAMPVS